jgi:single-stranded DNA-binding protein
VEGLSGARENMSVKGTNVWCGSGNVASDVHYGETGRGDSACNFRICVEEAHKPLVYVRVNVYGGNVDVCKMRSLGRGDYVIVEGELMNRKGQDDFLTEIRCKKIVITDGRRKNG